MNLISAPPFGRETSFLRVIDLLQQTFGNKSIVIIETGTIRGETNSSREGDGWSTLLWSWYAQQTHSLCYSVDINEDNLLICDRVLRPYNLRLSVNLVKEDSIIFLKNFKNKIDFLYLDSLGPDEEGINVHLASQHQLNEAAAVLERDGMNIPGFILLDDVPENRDGGKCLYVIDYLKYKGWNMVFHDTGTTQMLFRKI